MGTTRGLSWAVIVVTFVLEIIAFGLALGAVARRSKATLDTQLNDQYCAYSSDIATGLAVGALLFLALGQIIIMGVTNCFCGSGPTKGRARLCAIVAFLLTWFCFVVAEICLIVGAALNSSHTTAHLIFLPDGDPLTCKQVRKSAFATGAAFTFLTLFFGEIYYVSLVKASNSGWDNDYKNGASIDMTAYP